MAAVVASGVDDAPAGPGAPVAPRPVRGSVFVLAATTVGCGMALGASSVPGGSFLLAAGATVLLLLAGAGWLVSAGIAVVARVRRRPVGRTWALAVAAGLVVVSFGLDATEVPLRARWLAAEPAFDRVVDAEPAADGSLDVPGRLGTFQVRRARRSGDDVFVYTEGGLFGEVGFAHLPDGPDGVVVGERSSFSALGDDWYVFTSSF